jgi:hypothetical protein
MKKTAIFIWAIALLIVMSGCKKDSVSFSSLQISAERFTGDNGKAYINNNYANWENGDQIRLSVGSSGVTPATPYDGTVSITNSGHNPVAEVSADGLAANNGDSVVAGYPQSMFSGVSMTKGDISVTMPASYTYSEAGGHQKIESPMIAKLQLSETSKVLKFKNACVILKITITAPTEAGLATIDWIEVEKTAGAKGLSGAATLNYNDDSPTLTMNDSRSLSNNKIQLNFGANAIPISNSTGNQEVYLPIPPLQEGDVINITIHNGITDRSISSGEIEIKKNMPSNAIASITAPAPDVLATYTRYDWIRNDFQSSDCLIDLGAFVSPTTKMEMTFVPTHINGSQYYSGSRNGGDGTIYFAIAGSSSNTYFVDGFMGRNLHTAGSSYSGTDNSTQGVMERVQGVKYRHSLEVKSAGGSLYYGFATFERLDNNTVVTGCTDTLGLVSGYNSNPIYVFGYGNNYCPGMKLYRYRVWSDYSSNTLSHNFVPAIKHNCLGGVDSIGVLNMVDNNFIPCDKATSVGGTTGSYFTVGND